MISRFSSAHENKKKIVPGIVHPINKEGDIDAWLLFDSLSPVFDYWKEQQRF